MPKQRHSQKPPETPSRAPLAMMAVGALLVTGLIVWALTRTVEPSNPTPSVSSTITPSSETTGSLVPPIDSTVSIVPPINTVSNPPTTTASITTSSAAPAEVPQGDRTEVPRISAEDLREKVKAGTVTVIDTRHDESAYTAGHIPGAIFVPMASIGANLDRIPKDKEVVAYCT